MGSGKKSQTFMLNDGNRNLGKNDLGGVIFGCNDTTYEKCFSEQLFGLPAPHFSYIKNIDPGLPLFLFNYSGRKLHGIFEAASPGQLNINPYAWTTNGSERTTYPAQVQVRIRLQCNPLSEEQFKPVIKDNYYRTNKFSFELDHAQTSKLVSLLLSQPVSPSVLSPQYTQNWRPVPLPQDKSEETESFAPEAVEGYYPYPHPHMSDEWRASSRPHKSDELGDFPHPHMSDKLVAYPHPHMSNQLGALDANNHPREDCVSIKTVAKEKDRIIMKLKELALDRECSDLPSVVAKDDVGLSDHSVQLKEQKDSEERSQENPVNLSDYASVVAQLVQEVVELKAFKEAHIEKLGFMDRKLVEAEAEIGKLKHRCAALESLSNISRSDVIVTSDSAEDLQLDVHEHESLFLVGGYDGVNWLSTLDSYSPTNDMIKSLKPMSCIRSYSSLVKLNGEFYAFAGGNGFSWYDTVESYNPENDQWTLRPSLSTAKGSLAGGTLNNKIFAIGGGNGCECLADVEMLDLEAGRWISTQSMLQKRFALGAVELNGALYAVGGYDGTEYLSSAERFDPREHSWRKIENMKSKRGCHSLVVLNEKIYAIGGHNSDLMVPSVEIYDPRLCSWMEGEPMNHSRGYSAAVVLGESIYVIGGIITNQRILDTVECYKEGQGWKVSHPNAIGKRAFCSAIVL